MKTLENKIYDINAIVNANTTEMVDGTKWIVWAKNRIKAGLSVRRLNYIAANITA